ncbi:MAG TPA: FAD-dependent oxidoreductase [Solirubrobacterales bacterium]|nr:FAD-dependent oxidoreductase [Solirubrobacterales bacterium]
MSTEPESMVILGGGPAGYTAALYAARADLDPVVIEGPAWGGLLQQTTEVENFPGFPAGIMGPELMQAMREQAGRFGARFVSEWAEGVELGSEPGEPHTVRTDGERSFATRTLVLAMGADHRRLGVPGEAELIGRGVSYCATCDAAFFRDAEVLVVGGGDSAMEEAVFLARFAAQVTVVHRRDDFRASPIMLERARQTENVAFLTGAVVEEFAASDGRLPDVRLRRGGEAMTIAGAGTFVAIGHEPNSELVAGQIELDEHGYVITMPGTTAVSRPGVFAAGDLVDSRYRQAVTAAGSGCSAALDAQGYLR